MAKMLALLLLLALVEPLHLQAAEPVPPAQQAYLNAYLRIQDAEAFEREGNLKSAYISFSNALLLLLPLRNDPVWEIALIDKRLKECSVVMHELKINIIKQGLTSSRKSDGQFLLKIKEDIGSWKKLQNDKFRWAADLIAARITDDKDILAAVSAR